MPGVLMLAYYADNQAGHGWLLWLFALISAALLLVMRVTPVSWFYSFIASFFLLGCWLKVMIHHIFDYSYVEPIGNFSNSPAEWHDYYIFSIAIGSAMLFARLISLVFGSWQYRLKIQYIYKSGPVSARQWLMLVIIACVYYTINNFFGFFVTGVHPSLILPFGLNAPIAFLSLVGASAILSVFVARDVQSRGRLSRDAVLAIVLIASVASVSMASRAAVIMQAGPILLAAFYLQSRWGRFKIPKAPIVFFLSFVLMVLVGVSIYRIEAFKIGSYTDGDLAINSLLESAMLVVDRWIGAEAIMVAVSSTEKSYGLLAELIVESPTIGVESIYQQISGGKYELQEGFTFLTLPGYFGVFSLSGDVIMLMVLVFGMTLFGLWYELLINKLLMNQLIPVALICAALANALSQMSFPVLLLPFLFQMTVLAAILGRYMRNNMGLHEGRYVEDVGG